METWSLSCEPKIIVSKRTTYKASFLWNLLRFMLYSLETSGQRKDICDLIWRLSIYCWWSVIIKQLVILYDWAHLSLDYFSASVWIRTIGSWACSQEISACGTWDESGKIVTPAGSPGTLTEMSSGWTPIFSVTDTFTRATSTLWHPIVDLDHMPQPCIARLSDMKRSSERWRTFLHKTPWGLLLVKRHKRWTTLGKF